MSGQYPDGSDGGNGDNGCNGDNGYQRGAPVMDISHTFTVSQCKINEEGFNARPDGPHGFKIFVYGYPKGPVHKYYGTSYSDGTILISQTWVRNDARFNFIKLVGGQVLSGF